MTFDKLSRRTLLKSAAAGGAALAASGLPVFAAEPAKGDRTGLRDKVDHIIVIFQENRSFDHYFGTYRSPQGHAVENLLDAEGKVSDRFTGLQANPAGIPYNYLPVPYDLPGFAGAVLENKPFALAEFLPATHNVPWDPAHHFFRMFAQVNGGKMDRFVALALAKHHGPLGDASESDRVRSMFAQSRPSAAVVGYYTRRDLPFYHRLADEYVLHDNFFQAISGGSTANALYLVAARSAVSAKAPKGRVGSLERAVFDMPYDERGILINDLPPLLGPTETAFEDLKIAPDPQEQSYPNIGDRLAEAGLSWAWYNENWNAVKPWAMKSAFGAGDGSAVVDAIELYVPHHNPFQYYPSWQRNVKAGHMRDAEDFFEDLRGGRLPSVSFVKATGIHDEHPADSAPRWGEQWVQRLLQAVGESPLWGRVAVVMTYDEGGGFWDHVPPPRPDAYGCGTRIPAFVIGPWARRGFVDHRVGDTTSVLALIEARFGLEPLQKRDAEAYDLLGGFDFEQRRRDPSFG